MTKSKKIAFILSGFHQYYLKALISLFAKNGYDIDLYANREYQNDNSDIQNIYNFSSEINESNPEHIEKLNQELEEMTKNKNYNFILGDCCPLKFGCNVFHRHSLEYRKNLSPNFLYKLFFIFGHLKKLSYFKKWHTSNHQKIFVTSKEMKKDYASALSIPEDKIVIVPPGTDLTADENIKPKNFSKEEFVLGLSAVGFSSKGGYLLLDAIRRIKNPNIKCKIIYPKHEKNNFLKFLIKIMGIKNRVEFIGYQKNMSEFYNSIDCLITASLAEAFGRVITEAMMHKTPVIMGSNVGACDVIEDGKNGFIFEFSKTSGKNLANKIKEVYQKRQNLSDLIENAYQTASSITWDDFALKIFETLSEKN